MSDLRSRVAQCKDGDVICYWFGAGYNRYASITAAFGGELVLSLVDRDKESSHTQFDAKEFSQALLRLQAFLNNGTSAIAISPGRWPIEASP